MSFLDRLPLELATEILSHLPSADLARVCRVSRHIYGVCQRVLYTAVSFTSSLLKNPPSLQILLRTLLSPGGDVLAAHARSLRVVWDNAPSEHTRCPADMALIAAAAARLHLPMSNITPSDQIILLLHVLSPLQALELGPSYRCEAFPTFLETPLPRIFHRLREFRQHPSPTTGAVPLAAFLALLRLPSLRTLDVRLVYRSFFVVRPDEPSKPGTSGITSLCLRRSCLSESVLQAILRLPAALTHFSYTHETVHLGLVVDVSKFPLALVSATLTHLHIDLSAATLSPLRDNLPRPTICSLRDWHALRTLQCSLTSLLGWERRTEAGRLAEVLPAGLRELEILADRYWAGKEMVVKVVEMLDEKESMLPALERLVMSVGRSGNVLREACGAAEVVLVARKAGGENRPRRKARTRVTTCRRGPE